jgi:sortase A
VVAAIAVIALMNMQVIYTYATLWLQPGTSTTTAALPQTGTQPVQVSQDPRIVIGKINVDAPVVYDVASRDEARVQKGLERGVVHYGDTALPGTRGNAVFFGHSSNSVFAAGDYKFVFALLERLEVGDTYQLNYKGVTYVYRVTDRTTVHPTEVGVAENTGDGFRSTLITCTPVGTSLNRLVIHGEQISPAPSQAN